MQTPPTSPKVNLVSLKALLGEPPVEVYLLPVSGFPMPEQESRPLAGAIRRLTALVSKEWKLFPEVFIQFAQVHLGDAKIRLASHGREWIPTLGLGVWPDRPAPTIWKREEFMNLGVGEKPPRLMHQVFRVSASPEARAGARESMFGLGTIVQIMTCDEQGSFLQKARETLLPPIVDPSFTSFPFYVPLLEGKSVTGCAPEQIITWLSGAQVYMRESPEDNAILLVSSRPLAPIFGELGGHLLDGPDPFWQIPVTED